MKKRLRYDGIVRHFYHCALDSIDMYRAIELIEEMGPILKYMKGEDPDFVSAEDWFQQNSVKVNPPNG